MKPKYQQDYQSLTTALDELRNYANAVINLSEEMLNNDDDPLNELQKKDVQIMNNSARQLLEKTDDLLSLDVEDLVSFIFDENLRVIIRDRSLKADFLSKMKFDLITPVNSIVGFAQVVLEGIDGSVSESQANILNNIYENGKKSLQPFDSIYGIWRIKDILDETGLYIEEINPRQIIRRFLSYAIKYGRLEIVKDIPINLPSIWSNTMRFHAALHFTVAGLSERFERGKIVFKASVSGREITIGIQNEEFLFPEFAIKKIEQVRVIDALIYGLPPVSEYNTVIDLCIGKLLVEMLGGKMHLEKVETSAVVTFALPIKYSQFQGAI